MIIVNKTFVSPDEKAVRARRDPAWSRKDEPICVERRRMDNLVDYPLGAIFIASSG
jgi:hypothetical protein